MRLEPLLTALRELFGPRLGFGEVQEGDREVVILWDGRIDSVVGLAEGELENAAWQLLSTAQDIWLRGLGGEGTHPGAWATASPEIVVEATGLRLVLLQGEREIASVTVPNRKQERGRGP
ncbi:hypothetical protein [Deinococcus terrestris]|uniref:hypothetical protein n=1 Tax=Deinococcus terrestris TaxID=2651870 RepID=UPI0018834962|nr:hypothetical protein [Deinococcus terrestris]